MKKFRDEVNEVRAMLMGAEIDAEKFDNGNESAGRRARAALSKIAGRCVLLKREMMAATKGREDAKK